MESVWEKTAELRAFPALEENIATDVLIIGGGMAGVLCAYMLRQAGIDCVLVEAERICGGVTKNTTAKITSQHGLIYDRLIRRFGVGAAGRYLAANEAAIRRYSELCRNIDCDFERVDSYVYSLSDRKKLTDEVAALRKLGFPAELEKKPQLPFSTAGAVKFGNQAQFNPLKFVAGISRGLRIYEHTRVTQLFGLKAVTARGAVEAKRIIVATHFPFINKHGGYFIKLYQHRSYVIALENAPQLNGMYVDEAQNGMSFRSYGNYLLIGGGDHRTGKDGGGWRELRSFAARFYPDCSEKFHWAAQDCMSLDGVPYIGRYSDSTRGLYVVTGFNKWGMSSSMVAATIMCDRMSGTANPYAAVFSPSRSILTPQLAVNAFEATANMLTPTARRCPHLGCALRWNKTEHTWDCPCHGSRFTRDGRLIDNPATDDLRM